MNAQTLLLTLTKIESKDTDMIVNAENVLSALKRMKNVPGMNTFMVRSATRRQEKFIKKLKRDRGLL